MKKQLISFILIFTMMLTLLPQLSLTAFAASTPDTSIGLDLSSCTSDWTGTGSYTGVSWISSTKTLTLTNANIHGKDNASVNFGIKVPDGTRVVLNGNNTITGGISSDNNSSNYGLWSMGDLTIQGTGSLVATGGLNTGITGFSQGISASTLTVSGGTVTATGGSAAMVSGGVSNGICVGTTVTISGGIVTATAGSAYTSIGMIADTVNLNSGLFIARAGVAGFTAKAFRSAGGSATIINYGTDMGVLTGSPTANYAVYGNTGTHKVNTAGLDFSGNPVDTGNLITDGYQWVQSTKTLTTSNLILNTTALSAIKLPDGAILDVQGSNVIRSGDSAASSAASYGINCAGALTIQDSGAITSIGGNLTGYNSQSYGISSVKSTTISSTTVNAIGGTAKGYSYGIYGTGGASSINISSGNVTAIGGTATATAKPGDVLNGSFSCGIMQPSNIIAISGGNITAIGGTVNLDDSNAPSAGLFSNYPPTITGGNISAIGGTTAYSSNGNSNGIFVNTGNKVAISGGNITAIGYTHGFQSIGLILTNNEAVPVASTNIDGSSSVTYVDANLGIYKYVKVGIPTYTATINLKKDDSAWASSGKTISLQKASETPTETTEAGGVFKADVINGTWKILADGTDTGSTIQINNGAASQDLNYYTVQFAVTSTGTASGSTISATYNSSEIHTGDVVLGGKQLEITTVGQGSSNYTYLWSGTGAHGETAATFIISSLGEPLNVICIVSSKAPKITTTSLPDGTVGTAYNQNLYVLTIAPITFDITGSLPAGINMDLNTGAITGTPTTAGTYNFTVTATNAFGADTKSLNITIISTSTAPTITTTSLADGTVGTAYSQTLAATGTAPITWSITGSGTLPGGLSLDSDTGEITGTPTTAETASFSVTASNGVSPDDTKALSITVTTTGAAVTLSTLSLPNGTVGTAYSQTLAATGTAPITWSITGGTLPAGLSLDPNTGAITGTPTTAETSNFSVTAANAFGTDTKLYTITVTAIPATYALTITAGSGGTVSSAGGTYTAGAPVSITATPNSSYSFSGWTTANGGSFADRFSSSTTFTMPANNTTITAVFTYNGGGGGGGSGTTTPATTPESTPATTPTQVPIIVDNNNYYIGNVDEKDNTATITVDQSEFDKQLSAAKYSVVIPVTSDARTVVAQLVVKNVQDMNDKGVPLTVQTGNINYNIPASSIDTKAILSALGASDPSLAPVNVTIKTDVDSAIQALANSSVKASGAEVVVPAVQFEITASYNGKTYNIENFDHFVNRSIEITKEQAQQITTAIVVNTDGTTRHVPTFIYQKNNKWYATINSLTNSTYVLIFNQMSFADSAGKWYQSVVNEMGSREIISGIGKNSFAGDKDITRAEFASIVVRALGLPTKVKSIFSDVPSNAWYSGAVATAAQYGIVSGIGSNKFAPNAKITREEAMQMVYNASRLTPYAAVTGTDNTKDFVDYGTQSAWATSAVNFNLNNGFIRGYNKKFNPKSNITRAETATVVLKLLQKSNLVDVRTEL